MQVKVVARQPEEEWMNVLLSPLGRNHTGLRLMPILYGHHCCRSERALWRLVPFLKTLLCFYCEKHLGFESERQKRIMICAVKKTSVDDKQILTVM